MIHPLRCSSCCRGFHDTWEGLVQCQLRSLEREKRKQSQLLFEASKRQRDLTFELLRSYCHHE